MVLNEPDAKLLLEVFSNWLGGDDWDEDGTPKEPEYKKLMQRLQSVADGNEYNISEIDATTWRYKVDEAQYHELMLFFEDDKHILIDLCSPQECEEGEHSCNRLATIRLNMVTGEIG